MKIAIISENPNPHAIGGGEYAIYKYGEALAKRGHDVDVYGLFTHPYMGDLVNISNYRIHVRGGCAWRIRGAGKINHVWGWIHSRIFLEQHLRNSRFRPDVIFGYPRRSSIKAHKLSVKTDIPSMHFAFETPEQMAASLGKQFERVYVGALKREWDEVKSAYQASRGLLPLTSIVGEAVTAWSRVTAHPPVYIGLDGPNTTIKSNEAGSYILYIGRLDCTKNVADLIKAIALMKSPLPLVIAGGGHDECELRQLVAKTGIKAEFRGVVNEPEKWRLFQGCCFTVFPSSVEGFGMPPGEALTCGRPAICSDIPVLREVYGDAVEYFPLHDISALACLMDRLCHQPGYCRDRGLAGRTFVLSRYTWEKAAERIEAAMSNVQSLR